jgi:hypothetical protein
MTELPMIAALPDFLQRQAMNQLNSNQSDPANRVIGDCRTHLLQACMA